MGRILAIDYGQKRTGFAVTDELQIIATSLGTVATKDIWKFLTEYSQKEKLDAIVVGEPRDMRNRPSDSSRFVEPFVNKLRKTFPNLKIERFDERFTSKIAHQAMIDGGLRKQKRQDKALVDSISATLILQSYLESLNILKK
jgi:putative Holliday junction resolvase